MTAKFAFLICTKNIVYVLSFGVRNYLTTTRRDIEAYAYEELVAEIGAAFLCAHCGLLARMEHDSWLDALRHDKRLSLLLHQLHRKRRILCWVRQPKLRQRRYER